MTIDVNLKLVMVGSAELHIEGWEEILKDFIRLHTNKTAYYIHILYVKICVVFKPLTATQHYYNVFSALQNNFSTGIKFTRYILLAYTERTQAYEKIYCLVYSITTYRNILSYFQILANTQSSKLA